MASKNHCFVALTKSTPGPGVLPRIDYANLVPMSVSQHWTPYNIGVTLTAAVKFKRSVPGLFCQS
jgi:hypothetical protein